MKCKKQPIAGAKVLHNRCIQIGKKFDCDIIAKSTFSNEGGTKICQQIETSEVKSIVKNDKLLTIEIEKEEVIEEDEFYNIYQDLLENNIIVESFEKEEHQIQFRIKQEEQNKVQELFEKNYKTYQLKQKDLVKLSIVGYGITQDNQVLNQVIQILKEDKIKIMDIHLTQSKIEILVEKIDDTMVEELHQQLIKK